MGLPYGVSCDDVFEALGDGFMTAAQVTDRVRDASGHGVSKDYVSAQLAYLELRGRAVSKREIPYRTMRTVRRKPLWKRA